MRCELPSRWIGLLLLTAGCAGGEEPIEVHPCPEDQPGIACTWAGIAGKRGFNNDGKDRRDSWLYFVEDLTFAPDGRAWVLDWNNHRVRRVEADGTLSTVIGTDYEGDGPVGQVDRLPLGTPAGAPATEVALNHPTDIEFMPDGTVVLAAWHNNKVRTVDPDTGILTVLAGDSYGFGGDGELAYKATFNQPKAIAIDAEGNVYTNDQRNQRIRMISTDGMIRTIAGTGAIGFSGDGGPADQATFSFDVGVTPRPSGALVLRDHELFVADSNNNAIRRINLDTGMIDCVVGAGCTIDFELAYPLDLEFGPDARLYVADRYHAAIQAIDLVNGTVERVAGNGQPCPDQSTLCVEEGIGVGALELQLNEPYGLAFDADGNLYVADTHNSRIVRIAR